MGRTAIRVLVRNRLDLFSFLKDIRNYRCNIYIEVIENEQDNCSNHYKGRQDEVISPADIIHTCGSQRFGLLYGGYYK